MQWVNVGLYHAKAIYAAKKKAAKNLRKAKQKALKEAVASRLTESEIQAALAQRRARIAGAPVQAKPQYQPAPKYSKGMGKDFYLTREWRELRYSIFAKHGRKCQCCGQTQGYLHVDHIKPRSIHPELELDADNLQVLCEACNIGKSNKDATDWRN